MKMHKIFTLMVVFAMLAVLVPTAAAQGPTGDWISGIACQNLDNVNAADVTLSFYLADTASSQLDYDPADIPAGGSANYFTPNLADLDPEFLGSVVIQSSTPLACNVNTQTTGAGTADNPRRVGTSAGFGDAETSTTMYVPQVMDYAGSWGSYIAVQNATANAVDVTVSYADRTGAAIDADETATIPGYSNHVFYQSENADLPENYMGAATVTADGAVAVTVNMYNAGTNSSDAQLLSYNGFAEGSTKLLVPRFVRRFYGYNSGLSIQNIGTVAAPATIVFTFDGVPYTVTTADINPGAAAALYAPNIAELLPVDSLGLGARFGSAVITSAQPIIAIVNEDNRGDAADNNGAAVPVERISQGTTYNAFLDGTQTPTIFFAQITKAASVFSGGFQVANTEATDGACTATFNAVSPAVEYDFDLPANGSASVYAPNVAVLTATMYNGSVTLVCDVDIVGISNMAAAPGSGSLGDSFTQGNGLNR